MSMPSDAAPADATAPPARWAAQVRWLHWLGVALILAVAAVGLTMGELERGSDTRRVAYALHKSLGITVLALALLRVSVRAFTRAPVAAAAGPAWAPRLAQATHLLMYALMFVVPLSGWWLNSVAGQPLPWFGLVDMPALADRNPDLRGPVRVAHTWLFWSLAALVGLHVLAAALHQCVLRDGTLSRMLPGRRESV